jgi:Cu2+-exporting ATPase/Cu+-exporting ATPase
MPKTTVALIQCEHCGGPANGGIQDLGNHFFCCSGCQFVYKLLNGAGLKQYYNLKEKSPLDKPISSLSTDFSYLDDEIARSEYLKAYSDQTSGIDFYLDGIHCIACLWLLERLPSIRKDILSSHLNLSESVLTVQVTKSAKLSQIAALIEQLGYRPHPIALNSNTLELRKREDRQLLTKIGVAAMGASNTMLYSIGLYVGADQEFLTIFNSLSMLLALPVVTFSATPFYRNAWNGIKNNTLSIDFPIAIALILGFIASSINVVRGNPHTYFDTLSILVFLLLFSRFILRKSQYRMANQSNLNLSTSSTIKKIVNHEVVKVTERDISSGDIIQVDPGEMIPVDGEIHSGRSLIGLAALTGESIPIPVGPGDQVFSGTMNFDLPLKIKALEVGAKTRLGKIVDEIRNTQRNESLITRNADIVSRYLISIVLLLATVTILYFSLHGRFEDAFSRTLALIIITCPCALGLATPLSFIRAMDLAQSRGILIKNEEIIERLSHAKDIFFDKTGTLTIGKFNVEAFNNLSSIPDDEIHSIVTALESRSQHPIGKSLLAFSRKNLAPSSLPLTPTGFSEIAGVGVQALFGEDLWEIMGQQGDGDSKVKTIVVIKNQEVVASFEMSDQLRPESKILISKLSQMNLKLWIISGDQSQYVRDAADALGVPTQQIISSATPEEKAEIVKNSDGAVMIGDGINDALAFVHSLVAIAVSGSVEIGLKTSDVYIESSQISRIGDLFIIAKETMKTVKRNLILSLSYNLIGIFLAINGTLSPLVAAVLMPLSSVSVILSTIFATKELRNLSKKSL